jgi:uncharacterized membrane protein YfcA
MATELLTVLIGAFIGMNSGMFGVGGALLATPLLRVFLELPEVFAVATPLPAAIPAAISGSIVYLRNRLVRFDVAWRTLVTAIPMSQVGVVLTGRTPGPWLMALTGALLAYTAWVFIERGFRRAAPAAADGATEASHPDPMDRPGLLYAGGALAGFLSGFLAIGGGIVLVPVFVKLLGMEAKQAVATSLLCVVALAIPGTIGHAIAGNILWDVALLLAIGVVPFGYLGARLTSSLRTRTLERVYGLVMLVFAVYFVVREL